MCGRFIMSMEPARVKRRFDVDTGDFDFSPRYNIAPAQQAAVIVQERGRILKSLRWGLIPFWAKDPSIGARLINARAETLLEKPSFKSSFLHRRCLVPANGFYEWKKEACGKTPICIMLKGRELFSFAGLWDSWQSPEGKILETFTIITTESNEIIRPIHNRMPVILSPGEEELWLNPGVKDAELLSGLLDAYPADCMEAFAVSALVNSSKIDGPECIIPV